MWRAANGWFLPTDRKSSGGKVICERNTKEIDSRTNGVRFDSEQDR